MGSESSSNVIFCSDINHKTIRHNGTTYQIEDPYSIINYRQAITTQEVIVENNKLFILLAKLYIACIKKTHRSCLHFDNTILL